MTVVRLDDDELDDEDRAILAEVARKGYYHGRPKSVACAPPARIVEAAPAPIVAEAKGTSGGRAQFDEFQRKWDRFDRDEYLDEVEAKLVTVDQAKVSSQTVQETSGPGAPYSANTEFKLLLVGDGAVGKTALARRLLTGEFAERSSPSEDVTVNHLRFGTNCGEVTFNVWDLGCTSQNFTEGCVRESHFRQAQCAIIMFDMTSRASYKSVPGWFREITRLCGALPIVLVGNKADVKHRVLQPRQILFYRKKNIPFYMLSVREQLNVERPFLWLARRLVNQPHLQFVACHAKYPEAPLDPALFEEHARLLEHAQLVPVQASRGL